MNRFSFRPQVESLDGRVLPSGNPTISINDVALVEDSSGQTAFVFSVSLSKASSKEVSIDFATADGSATLADNDYVPTSGRLKFAPGETTKTITVLVNGDTRYEGNETCIVNLSRARNAVIADAQGVGTILNDDDPPAPIDPDPVYDPGPAPYVGALWNGFQWYNPTVSDPNSGNGYSY